MLYYKQSTLTNAGRGLFTTCKIFSGDHVCQFHGEYKQYHQADKSLYLIKCEDGLVFDATPVPDIGDQMASYANDAEAFRFDKSLPPSEKSNNCEIHKIDEEFWLVATTDIPANSELFVGYGAEYWQN